MRMWRHELALALALGLCWTWTCAAVQTGATVSAGVARDGYEMSEGAEVRVVVKPDGHDGSLRFGLCGDSSCSYGMVVKKKNELKFNTETSKTNRLLGSVGVADPKIDWPFPGFDEGSNYTFIFNRKNKTSLEFWLDGSSSSKRSIKTKSSENTFRFLLDFGFNYFTPEAAGGGHVMKVGDEARLRLVPTLEHGQMRVGFCGESRCDVFVVKGISYSTNKIGHSVYHIKTNTINTPTADYTQYSGKEGFEPEQPLTFIVKRRSSKTVELKLEDVPGSTIELQTPYDNMKVYANVGYLYFIEGDAAPDEPDAVAANTFSDHVVRDGYSMSVQEQIRMILNPDGHIGTLYFGLCGTKSCTYVAVRYGDRDTTYTFAKSTTNGLFGVPKKTNFPTNKWPFRAFRRGFNQTFIINRVEGGGLEFWVKAQGAPSTKLTIPTETDENVFRVLCDIGSTYFVPEEAMGAHDMGVGEVVRLRIEPTITKGQMRIGFCGENRCDVFVIKGINHSPAKIGYSIYHIATNSINTRTTNYTEYKGPEEFEGKKNTNLLIRRRSGQAVELWMEEDPSTIITMNTPYEILKVYANVGFMYFVEGYKDDVQKEYGAVCGKSKPTPLSLVQNGQTVTIDSTPWHAGIYQDRNGETFNICGGSLVSPCFVLTAAHCVSNDQGYSYPSEEFHVALGKTLSGWETEHDPAVHRSEIKRVIVNPLYRGHSLKLSNDIALLEMAKCANLSGTIFPICIDGSVTPLPSESIQIAGWGNGSTSLAELATVSLTYMSQTDCFKAIDSNRQEIAFVTADKFCTPRPQGSPLTGLLKGDSGGGATIKRKDRWFLQGVVSSLLHSNERGDIFTYTDVAKYTGWIASFTSW